MHKYNINKFQQIFSGTIYSPEDDGYEQARQAWSLNTDSHPQIIAEPLSTKDVQAAVKFANKHSLAIAVQITGHGTVKPSDNALLLTMRKMNDVSINPEKRTALVAPGVIEADVIKEADAYSLAPITGTSPWVGVMGFTLGGGHGWLSREFGLAADSIIEAEVVTADGRILIANENSNADLLWALRGGSGNFGIVTSLEFKLYHIDNAFAGSVYYDIHQAEEIMKAYRDWVASLPNAFTASLMYLQLPQGEQLPETIRGKKVIALQLFYNGTAENAQSILAPFYERVGKPLQNFTQPMRYADFMMASPKLLPTANLDVAGLQGEFTDEEIKKLATYMHIAQSFAPIIEIRYWNGKLGQKTNERLLRYHDVRFSVFATVSTTGLDEQGLRETSNHFSDLKDTIKAYASSQTFINFISDTDLTSKAFTQKDYQHLVDLKTKFDPRNIFRLNHNIPPK